MKNLPWNLIYRCLGAWFMTGIMGAATVILLTNIRHPFIDGSLSLLGLAGTTIMGLLALKDLDNVLEVVKRSSVD